MNNKECAHVWAAQSRERGKGYGNLYFEGPTIYSYGPHFPIASFTDKSIDGARLVLFTTASYSISTSKHMGYVRSALDGLDVRVIYVPHVTHPQHAENIEYMEREFSESLLKASRALKNKDFYITRALEFAAAARDYCDAYEIARPAFTYENAISAEQVDSALAADKQRKAEKARKAEADKAARMGEYERRAELWRAGGNAWELELHTFGDFPTLLRVASRNRIETSRGAFIPTAAARKLWPLVKRTREAGVAYAPQAHNKIVTVGDFRLITIKANGDAVIGCHDLAFAEMERAATALGIA